MAEHGKPGAGQRRDRLSRLLLTGFMGAGKSTVGALLAASLGWRFVDLDRFIEEGNGEEGARTTTVAEIFRTKGEGHFRSLEAAALRKLGKEERIVLALGGGTIENEGARRLLALLPGACMVFLDAPLPELLSRCRSQAAARPLLTTPEALSERLERRLPLYRTAQLTVETAALSPSDVASKVLEGVAARWDLDLPEARSAVDSPTDSPTELPAEFHG